MENRIRLETLDLLRGLTLVSMILYHGMWDFLYLSEAGAAMEALRTWYKGSAGYLWQQSICCTFILLSGFCVPLSRHIFRRGLLVSACGALVSAVTLLFMNEERILFGVLTFLGAAMLLTGLLQTLAASVGGGARKVLQKRHLHLEADGGRTVRTRPARTKTGAPGAVLPGSRQREDDDREPGRFPRRSPCVKKAASAAACLYLFYMLRWMPRRVLRFWPGMQLPLPDGLYNVFGEGSAAGYVMTGLGFMMPGFFSADYFPLVPWIFLFWAGMFLHGMLALREALDRPAFHLQEPVLNWMGRHSLLLYMLHQPVLYLLTLLVFS